MEGWSDLQTGRRRTVSYSHGRLMTEFATSVGDDGKLRVDIVFYVPRTWTTFFPDHTYKPETMAEYAQHYRNSVTAGIYKNLGHDQVDDRDTLHLQRHASFDTPIGTHTVTTDLWLDALTYLPVRQRSSSSGTPGGTRISETDYDWLPRTADNLLKLEFIAPDGFKHIKGTTSTSSSGSSSSLFSTTFVLHTSS
jgi:hypothetical protein